MIESKGRQIINGLSFNSKIALHHCFAKGLFFKGASENTKDKTFPKVMILMDFAITLHFYCELKIGALFSIPLFYQHLSINT